MQAALVEGRLSGSVNLYSAYGECYFCSTYGRRVRLQLSYSQQECVYLCDTHLPDQSKAVTDLRVRLDLPA